MTKSRTSVALEVEASPQIRFPNETWEDMSLWGGAEKVSQVGKWEGEG